MVKKNGATEVSAFKATKQKPGFSPIQGGPLQRGKTGQVGTGKPKAGTRSAYCFCELVWGENKLTVKILDLGIQFLFLVLELS